MTVIEVDFASNSLKNQKETPEDPGLLDADPIYGLPNFGAFSKLFADFEVGQRSPWKRSDRDLIGQAVVALTRFLADFVPAATPAELAAKTPAPPRPASP